jgi:hypothetical protein
MPSHSGGMMLPARAETVKLHGLIARALVGVLDREARARSHRAAAQTCGESNRVTERSWRRESLHSLGRNTRRPLAFKAEDR